MEVFFHPDASFPEVMKRYPDALAAEPIPERTKRTPTEAEAVELRANTLFEGELTDDDKLVYVNHVLKGKLMDRASSRNRQLPTPRNSSPIRPTCLAN
jgi:hypothetical protein